MIVTMYPYEYTIPTYYVFWSNCPKTQEPRIPKLRSPFAPPAPGQPLALSLALAIALALF
ncbi:hypothetical protein CTA1_9534 [Colletotrichum tanaceti]|uniref:Uncharacterized protein n=1 Tax=Colletotrichum tanaceti TaxID=1306861 RepID=A0A4U6X8K4_9PEZI|nr:hypothetical protein CTA1_9534 [Colletotrichum tanaceti]